jgi:peptidoglycan hydrolase-like protein with peptidoglycan-binding domain
MATVSDIKNFQMIHKLPQTGVMDTTLSNAIKRYQADFGLSVTGVIDTATLNKYKQTWPYAWGLSATSPVSGGSGSGTDFTPMLDKLIGGVLLYGIFRVLMKVF